MTPQTMPHVLEITQQHVRKRALTYYTIDKYFVIILLFIILIYYFVVLRLPCHSILCLTSSV